MLIALKRISAFFAIMIMAASFSAMAETIELKDGRIIVGDIIRESKEAVVISRHDGGIVYSITRDRIKNIRESTADEVEKEDRLKAATGKEAPDTDSKKTKDARIEELRKYRLEQYEKEVELAKQARGRVKIKFVEGRFGVVRVLLNNKVYAAMLADTGASMCVISRQIANQLGIEGLDKEGKIMVIMADGSSATAIRITLDSVEVGNSEVKNVEAAVTETPPGGGLDGLLGMTFLKHFHVKMDAKEDCLVLERY